MSPPRPPKDDQMLDDYLRGDSSLTRAYRSAANEQPPAEVDEAILAAARAQLESTNRTTRRRPAYSPFSAHWTIPVSAAAVLVITVGMGMFLTRDVETPMPFIQEGDALDETKPAAAPLPRKHLAAPPAAHEEMEIRQQEAPALSAPPRSADEHSGVRRPAAPLPETLEKKMESRPQPAAESVQRLTAPPTDAKSATDAAQSEEDSVGYRSSPERWLAHIDALRRAKRHAEADASLEEFRRAYPKHPLPAAR